MQPYERKSERYLYPLDEASKRLGGISKPTLYRWAQEGKLKFTRLGGRTFIADAEIVRLTNEGIAPQAA